MGILFDSWERRSSVFPQNFEQILDSIKNIRSFKSLDKLHYGDHGLSASVSVIQNAIENNKRIALYADYDVDGTMSAVSWIWFFEAIGFQNFLHYIPCRFKEGYGLNIDAVKKLIHEDKAEVIITMDTGITANEEANYCKKHGVSFICTDHHKIQPDKMPDCVILNPKLHPDPEYQELCGCGLTFVLLRKLAETFPMKPSVWQDLVALAGMATICDVVPLNSVNHRLAKLGMKALMSSQREVLVKLREATKMSGDESDVGFRVGPRINAVGRLEHADAIIKAFVEDAPDDLIHYMDVCNEERRKIQRQIEIEADALAKKHKDDLILFLGGDWHPGVVGIAASKIAQKYWKPTWLYNSSDICKGSARSVPGFDVTEAMMKAGFLKCGGHAAAGGFSFDSDDSESIREYLNDYAESIHEKSPMIWKSKLAYDFEIDIALATQTLYQKLSELKPYGHGFLEPSFKVKAKIIRLDQYKDKQTGEPRHTAFMCEGGLGERRKILYFNQLFPTVTLGMTCEFVVTMTQNTFGGRTSIEFFGQDLKIVE